jgi:hypothetical protein
VENRVNKEGFVVFDAEVRQEGVPGQKEKNTSRREKHGGG